MRAKIELLVPVLEKEIQKARRIANDAKESSNEIAKTAAGSWSAAGDRLHAEGQSQITTERLTQFENLMSEINEAQKVEKIGKITPACFVEIIYDSGEKDELYLVNTPVFINGVQFVSSKSPLGLELIGKGLGDKLKEPFNGKISLID